jgi:stearoyl-CoA desaturase (delta-9 desaturase)
MKTQENLAAPFGGQPSDEPTNHLSVSRARKLATLSVIIFPLIALAAVPFVVRGWGFALTDLGLLAFLYLGTVLGITVGFHRLFTHASFETTTAVKAVLAVLGSLAVQGSLFQWVALHRKHHQHSDKEEDPHSPHQQGGGIREILRGVWHAHMGWFFIPDPPNLERYIPDLRKSRVLSWIDKMFPLWVLLSLLIPSLVGGILDHSWDGALRGLIWGGLVRLFLVHHVTWSINSACHIWGSRPYESGDFSRNNMLFGFLAMGEGWHNSHHAFPSSARHGLRWWQIDASYWVIQSLRIFGLTWNVKVPTLIAQRQKRRAAA